uniref:Carbohydrate sulfotransferase n=1 Tax=Maylandia zebra TaxID=106582 RepID=A0A3P9BKR1_9CICH
PAQGVPRLSPSWDRCRLSLSLSQTELSGAAVLHQARRDQVVDACRVYSASSRKRRVLTPGDLKHLVVDEDHELIYCYVPRWPVPTGNFGTVQRGRKISALLFFTHCEINHRLKNYLKFLFVREPSRGWFLHITVYQLCHRVTSTMTWWASMRHWRRMQTTCCSWWCR